MPSRLLPYWRKNSIFNTLINQISADLAGPVTVTGLDGSSRNFFMAALIAELDRKTVIVTADQARAEKVAGELDAYLPDQVNLLPSREFFISADIETRSKEMQCRRLRFMQWASGKGKGIYVASFPALISLAIPPAEWRRMSLSLNKGEQLNRQDLIDQLVNLGYDRVTLAESVGQFSARGDIVDIFPPGLDHPVRIELFDRDIESLRLYDPLTQRSTTRLERIHIYPARELIAPQEVLIAGADRIRSRMEKILSQLRRRGENEQAALLNQRITRHLDRLAEPGGLDLLAYYLPYYYENPAGLIDYLPGESLVLVEEPADLALKTRQLRNEVTGHIGELLLENHIPGGGLLDPSAEDEIFARIPGTLVSCALFAGTAGLFTPRAKIELNSRAAPVYHGQWELFHQDYRAWLQEDYKVYLFSETEERGQSVLQLVSEQLRGDADHHDQGAEEVDRSSLQVCGGHLEEGFIVPDLKLAVLTESNLVPRRKKKRRYHSRGDGVRLSDYRELSPGDYVVHEQHGIGQYQGLHTLEVGGIKRDYLHLKYRGTDKLYLPIDQVGLIQKYSGGDGPAPRLHSLGGAEWQRLKTKVNRSVEELAGELLALYAARQAVQGFAFSQDHPWQQEFESNFPFEETPDQIKAIADVKADLEASFPMDRLICGDVGYGKTEVAMRAAFKVIMEGKQVAVLVPTTVLAQQHFRTFRERFEGFPVNIAQLSRFVSPAEQKKTIEDVARGKIDLVIGTHRLLSRDVHFHDLGLLVVDEEQRFGVKQKEKMKQMRLEVDTLAMTATPIPRTLHLSLAGARDLSIIDTPPEDRYPVQTYVVEYSENLVREAVQRELNRKGQVFIVYNRVNRINSFAEKIEKLFPGVEIAVGHGQMPERRLEQVMIGFQEKQYQVLISSTIIESGLDIPNVNTLIVCEADRFGLAQLYQIRGRVGRSNRLAYAYLTYRKDKIISETARKRLRAIREFTELGSGFKIALRDLEIRGAGNILGAEQHGFIAQVGFDLYVKLLDQAVAELKNEKREEKPVVKIELEANAFIPSSYINAQDQKIDLYQRIYRSSTAGELQDLEAEMTDRYATPPQPVRTLLKIAGLRVAAASLKISQIRQVHGSLVVQFSASSPVDADLISQIDFLPEGCQLKISSAEPLIMKIRSLSDDLPELDQVHAFLEEIISLISKRAGSSLGNQLL